MDIEKLFRQAQKSSFKRWVLNFLLQRYIPFNRPHNLRIVQLNEQMVRVGIPYKTKNFNHIKGLHACVLATASEFSSGLLLLYKLGFKKYRIIMKSMDVQYHYQGKKQAFAQFELSNQVFKKTIQDPLEKEGEVYVSCLIETRDVDGNKLSTAETIWQIKSWEKVKTKT